MDGTCTTQTIEEFKGDGLSKEEQEENKIRKNL